jgi:hypothetical protein
LLSHLVKRFSTEEISIKEAPAVGPKLPANTTTLSEGFNRFFPLRRFNELQMN